MTPRRGKRVVFSVAALGVVVLVVGAVAFKDRLAEQYYLWQLNSDDLVTQKHAADRLAEMGSVRAVPVMLELLGGADENEELSLVLLRGSDGASPTAIGHFRFSPDGTITMFSDFDRDGEQDFAPSFAGTARVIFDESNLGLLVSVPSAQVFLVKALWAIKNKAGKACARYLAKEISSERWYTRYMAAAFLGALGPDAEAGVPELIEALKAEAPREQRAWKDSVHTEVARALGNIGNGARKATPALIAAAQDENELVRDAAAEALRKIRGDDEAQR